MHTLAIAFTLLAALEHVWIFTLESFLWRKPVGLKTFRMDATKAEVTAPLAFNQGFYNLFLAAGMFWAALQPGPFSVPLRCFFLGCVVLAAIVGGLSVSKRILVIQGLPAFIGLALTLIAG